MLLL
ncbi:unnamed protein product [Linum tenue]|jgi:WASH complex subunit strumpellin